MYKYTCRVNYHQKSIPIDNTTIRALHKQCLALFQQIILVHCSPIAPPPPHSNPQFKLGIHQQFVVIAINGSQAFYSGQNYHNNFINKFNEHSVVIKGRLDHSSSHIPLSTKRSCFYVSIQKNNRAHSS